LTLEGLSKREKEVLHIHLQRQEQFNVDFAYLEW
jgi:hypothetical protein